MQHQQPPSQSFPMANHENNVTPMRTLFVGDLSFFCEDSDLRMLFSSFGEVISVEIKRGRATGDSLMHGFVEMDSEQNAEVALNELRNKKFLGRKMRVSWGSGPSEEVQNVAQEREHWIQLHVSFVSRLMDFRINEELLDNLFGRFGEVADVTIKRHKPTNEQGSQSGYGFVFYSDAIQALNAVRVMKHAVIDGVTYDCSISYKSERALSGMRDPNIQLLLQDYKNSSTASSTPAGSSHSQSSNPTISDVPSVSSLSVPSQPTVTSSSTYSHRSSVQHSDHHAGYSSQYSQQHRHSQRSPPPTSVSVHVPGNPAGRHSPRDNSSGQVSSSANTPSTPISSSRDGNIAPRMYSSPNNAAVIGTGTQAPLVSYPSQHQQHLVPHQQQQSVYSPSNAAHTTGTLSYHPQPQLQHAISPLVSHHAPYPLQIHFPSNGAPHSQSPASAGPPQLYVPLYGSPMPPAAPVAPPSSGYYITSPTTSLPQSQSNPHAPHAMQIYPNHPYMALSVPPPQVQPIEFMDYAASMHQPSSQHQHLQHQYQSQSQQSIEPQGQMTYHQQTRRPHHREDNGRQYQPNNHQR